MRSILALINRITISHFSFAICALIAAVCSRRGLELSSALSRISVMAITTGVSKKSYLLGAWVVAYFLLVRFVIANKSGRVRQWVRDVQNSTSSAIVRVSSNEAISRIRSSAAVTSCARLLNLAGCGQPAEDRALVISASDPFLSLDLIVTLDLLDIKELFYYAKRVNNVASFDREKFVSSLRPPAKVAVYALDEVTSASRGGIPLPTSRDSIDALYYAAVSRIFAEWRSVRLIPKNASARYAFGMGMARRDLLQNISKIEGAAHQWLLFHECAARQWQLASTQKDGRQAVESPTLRQLLERELDMNLHRQLPCLTDQSAASGLLWSKRQLQYQTSLLAFVLQVPVTFSSSNAAVLAAYKLTYEHFHGFLVRRIFQSSFEAAPSADELLSCMRANDDVEDDVQTENLTDSDSDDDGCWIQLPVDQPETTLLVTAPDMLLPGQVQTNILGRIAEEAQKYVSQCIGQAVNMSPSRYDNVLCATASVHTQTRNTTKFTERESKLASNRGDIPAFVSVVQPLLAEIEILLAQLNMNDPTKV